MVALSRKNGFDEEDLPQLDESAEADSIVSLALDDVDKADLAAVHTEVEERMLRWALDRSQNNLARAADMLGIPRSTLQYKLSKLEEQ